MLHTFGRLCARLSTHKPREWGLSDDYEVLSVLGKGSSARVFMGFNVLTEERVVIKMFKDLPPQNIKKEIAINKQLLAGLKPTTKHVQFMHLLDTCFDQTAQTFTLIYQFFPGVPLNKFTKTMSLTQSLRTVLILAHTLKYIHSLGFIHRDIKPANVLITPTGPKLFDFGLAKKITNDEDIKTNNFGTKCYKTPEVILHMPAYNHSLDVWALGLVLAELSLNHRHLLAYESDLLMLSQIASLCSLQKADTACISGDIIKNIKIDRSKSWERLAAQKNLSTDLIDLVRRMLRIHPQRRITLDQVIKHPAFRNTKLD